MISYFHTHRKWIVGSLLAGASGVLSWRLGSSSPWVMIVIPLVAVALGVNFTPNRPAS